MMRGIGWIVAAMALVEGGWLAFDGAHALIAGDYMTPRSGRFAGQLGPWSKLVEAAGIAPRSTLMKSLHLGLGLAWLAVLVCWILRLPWAWWGMLLGAAAGVWYLPFGTLMSVAQIVLLLLPALRSPAS